MDSNACTQVASNEADIVQTSSNSNVSSNSVNEVIHASNGAAKYNKKKNVAAATSAVATGKTNTSNASSSAAAAVPQTALQQSLVPALSKLVTIDASSGEMIFEHAKDFQEYAVARANKWETRKHGSCPITADMTPTKPCMFIYMGKVYDATEFIAVHPGGAEVMHDYNGKDITETFHDEYNFHGHTKTALNMLLQYRVGRVKKVRSDVAGEQGELEDYILEELTAYPKITEKEIFYKEFTIRRDRGLVWQAIFLSLPQYMHLINTPIYVPHCQLFDTALLEPFSKTQWWLVAALWLPLSMFWTFRGVMTDYTNANPAWSSMWDPYLYFPNKNLIFHNYPSMESAIPPSLTNGTTNMTPKQIAELQYTHALEMSHFSILFVIAMWLSGVVLWTLMEYFIHRVVFHFERAIPEALFDNPPCKWLHMLLHGIHHIIPMDPNRLVFPPALFVAASFTIYNLYSFLFTGSCLDILAGGVVFGYVCYDEIHYLIHHVDAQDFYFKDLKKYHHAHHYVDDTRGFGISSKFWDYVFRTTCKKN